MRVATRTAICLIAMFVTQINTQNVICDFENIDNDYVCTIAAANITSDTTPLEFLSQHLEGKRDSHVTTVRTNSSFNGRIRIYHPQFTVQFPNLQIIDLQKLRILDLSNNSFEKCDELRKINLHFNELNFLQDNLFINCSKLTELILSSNHLQILTASSFYGLFNLEVLNLNSNFINTISSDVFKNNRKLKELYLGYPWNLYEYDERMLQYLYDIEIIDLSAWRITFTKTEKILAGLTNLREVILRKNYFIDFNFDFFSKCKNLTVLDISNNNLRHIMNFSMQNLTSLKEFYIRGNNLEMLTEFTFNGLDNLEILWLGLNNIEIIFENTFDNLKNLKELDLESNKIDVLRDGIFLNQQNLRSLHLGVNSIDELLIGTFESLINLESINIYNNQIKSLKSNAFGVHEHLKYFKASWNKIDEIEPKFFDNFPNLEVLEINENLCTDAIIEDLQKVNVSVVLSKCFQNWIDHRTTTISTEIPTTTTEGGDSGNIVTFSALLIISLIFVIFMIC